MAKNKKFSVALTLFLAIACLVAGCAVGFLGGGIVSAKQFKSDEAPRVLVEGELQIHFLELGNKYTGDCTYIKPARPIFSLTRVPKPPVFPPSANI